MAKKEVVFDPDSLKRLTQNEKRMLRVKYDVDPFGGESEDVIQTILWKSNENLNWQQAGEISMGELEALIPDDLLNTDEVDEAS